MAIRVESNIFAPAPTRRGAALVPVATNLHRLAVPVNVPLCAELIILQSVNVPLALFAEADPLELHRINVPLAVPFPPNDSLPAIQSSNNPEAMAVVEGDPPCVPPNEDSPPVHFLYVPEYSIPYRMPELDVPLNTQFSI